VALHGDMHHGNILDFGSRGWLAIDSGGLPGDRYFDHGNIFCNPGHDIATMRGGLTSQIHVVAEAAGLERGRLLAWIIAWSGLSAVCLLDDGPVPGSRAQNNEVGAGGLAPLMPVPSGP
jgi:streptomycin 6-kinase